MAAPGNLPSLPFEKAAILDTLQLLQRKDRHRRTFGSVLHNYKLNPPLPVEEVEAFETKYSITLPEDYRYFITQVGNGGAGPFYGVFPLEGWAFNPVTHKFDEPGWQITDEIGRPFVHTDAWNLPKSFWEKRPDPPPGTSLEEEDRLWESWDQAEREAYAHVMDGAIPICHRGCGLSQWLVVNGEQKGYVWNDNTADQAGIAPLRDAQGRQVTFTDWYLDWLRAARDNPLPRRPSWVRTWKNTGVSPDWSPLLATGLGGIIGGICLTLRGVKDTNLAILVVGGIAMGLYLLLASLGLFLKRRSRREEVQRGGV
jgi:hypothetical protein